MRRAWSRCGVVARGSSRLSSRVTPRDIVSTTTRRPHWIRTASDLEALARRLAGADDVALDTEGDSLHHYPERLALLQIADRTGEAWLVDPLAIGDLAALAPVFATGRPLIVLHAGDNDLGHLKRRYGFAFGAIFDTSLAARMLGARALGLDVLLREHLGVELPPSRQKDDWSARPLTDAQERYAVADVAHLIPLRGRLIEALTRAGRLAWVEEECAALAAEPQVERAPDPHAFFGLKGARELTMRELAVLRQLHELREHLALAADRPPFKILSDATLVALARAAPRSVAELGAVSGCTPRVISRWGEAILKVVTCAQALGDKDWPTPPAPPRAPAVSSAIRRRIEALRRWRETTTPATGLEPGVLLPNRLIRLIAETAPRDLEGLGRVAGVRRWRVETFGRQMLAAIGS